MNRCNYGSVGRDGDGGGGGGRTPSQGHGYIRFVFPPRRTTGGEGVGDMELIVARPVSLGTDFHKQLHRVTRTITGYNTVDGCSIVPFRSPSVLQSQTGSELDLNRLRFIL